MGGELLTELSLLAPASLPEALRDVLVDISELQPLRWPNGALQELGTGARWAAWRGRTGERSLHCPALFATVPPGPPPHLSIWLQRNRLQGAVSRGARGGQGKRPAPTHFA